MKSKKGWDRIRLKTGWEGYRRACEFSQRSTFEDLAIYYSSEVGFYVDSVTKSGEIKGLLVGRQEILTPSLEWAYKGTRKEYKLVKLGIEKKVMKC
jgi:hypothetical protein